ncbi:MAG: S-layer protein [Bacillales bacterium]|jgi:hypothetical protein|nr:S-layer protein [Bacillales bacterium]
MYTPITKNNNKKYGNNRWMGYSERLKREVFLSSQLEYDHWVLVETESDVVNFCEQPKRASAIYMGRTHYSIIDAMVQNVGEIEEFFEIKYLKDLEPSSKNYDKVQKQIYIQKDWCTRNGFKHQVLTEKEIRGNTVLLENKKTILPYIKEFKNISPINRQKILNSILGRKSMFQDLFEEHRELTKNEIQTIVFELIFRKQIVTNIEEYRLGKETWMLING